MPHFYIIHLREFINSGRNIYKIGRTTSIDSRFKQYPKDSIVLFTTFVYDDISFEKKIIDMFKSIFIHRTDVGNEYFEGDFNKMRDIVYKELDQYDSNQLLRVKIYSETDITKIIQKLIKKFNKYDTENYRDVYNDHLYYQDGVGKRFHSNEYTSSFLEKINSYQQNQDKNIKLGKYLENYFYTDLRRSFQQNIQSVIFYFENLAQ
jgi:hypothetical protein